MACGNYKEYSVNYCPDAFIFSGYDNEIYVEWEFTNVNLFAIKIRGEAVSDGSGALTLPVDGTIGLTKEMFQHFTGSWEFRSYGVDSSGNIDPFVFCQDGEPYDFTLFNFQFMTPLPSPNNIEVVFETCVAL